MAGVFAELKDKQIKKFLTELSNNIKDVEGGANAYVIRVGPIALSSVQRHFEQEQGPKGKWDDWSESYKDFINGIVHFRKINGRVVPLSGKDPNLKKKPGNILRNNGRLINSTNIAVGVRGKKGEIPILVNAAKVKGGFPYAAHHDTGKSSWRGNSRPFMWLDDKAQENVAEETLDFITGD